jgi:hypothetical protein
MYARASSKLPLVALALLVTPSTLQAQQRVNPLQSITEAELRDHIYYLASDFLEGREAGERGYRLAAEYGAIHFGSAGLVPIFTDSSDAPTFFQQIKFKYTAVSKETVLQLSVDGDTRTYRAGEEFLAEPAPLAAAVDRVFKGTPVFLGYGIEEPAFGWNDYEGMDLAGKIALIVAGAPTRNGQPVLPDEQHHMYTGLMRSSDRVFETVSNHAASLLILVPDSATTTMWDRFAAYWSTAYVSPVYPAVPDTAAAPLSWIMLKPETAADLLTASGFDPLASTETYTRGSLNGVHVSLDIRYQVEDAFSSANVVALLPGTDPVLKEEHIVVTAHLDHVGTLSGEVFNGADDNARGCAAVLEAAEAAAMTAPKRSIIFALLTAEEKGLHGARYFAENPPVPIEKIVLNINLDMVGRNSPPYPESLLALASELGRPELLELITNVNTEVGARLDMRLIEGEDPDNHVSRSDQLAFMQKNIPAILLTRGFMQPDYHRASDDPQTINYAKVLQAARLAFALAVEAANGEALVERE